MNKIIVFSHWIGHSNYNTLYHNGFFEGKSIIDELEAILTGSPVYAKNSEVLVVAVEAYSDEYITAGSKASKINEASAEI